MLFPIDWEEPFGLVMIEAFACGTPVIATRRGSVPEVIDEAVTGFVVDDVAAMQHALSRVGKLDPGAIRAHAETRFAASTLVEHHLAVYERLHRSQIDERERLTGHVRRHVRHRDVADDAEMRPVLRGAMEHDMGSLRADRPGEAARGRRFPVA
jgi:Glycosyl transferases group 1